MEKTLAELRAAAYGAVADHERDMKESPTYRRMYANTVGKAYKFTFDAKGNLTAQHRQTDKTVVLMKAEIVGMTRTDLQLHIHDLPAHVWG